MVCIRLGCAFLDDNVLVQSKLLAVEDVDSAKIEASLEIVLVVGNTLRVRRWGLGAARWRKGRGCGGGG